MVCPIGVHKGSGRCSCHRSKTPGGGFRSNHSNYRAGRPRPSGTGFSASSRRAAGAQASGCLIMSVLISVVAVALGAAARGR